MKEREASRWGKDSEGGTGVFLYSGQKTRKRWRKYIAWTKVRCSGRGLIFKADRRPPEDSGKKINKNGGRSPVLISGGRKI